MAIRRYIRITSVLTLAGVARLAQCFWAIQRATLAFAMFLIMFEVTWFALLTNSTSHFVIRTNLIVSAAGTLFAGYYAVIDIKAGFAEGFNYTLGLSTCVYAVIVFVAILASSLRCWTHR